MKKVLFAINTLNNGGAEKVLLTLLRYLDPKKYEIHLLVVFGEGIYFEQIPQYVRVTHIFPCKSKEATKEILPLVPYKPYSGQKRRAQILDEEENLKILVEKICIAESPLHIAILKKRLMSITGVNKIKDEQNILILKSIKNNDRLEMKDDFI